MDTVSIISRIFFGDAMRATPPCARICAGTRSSAITAAAPAFSAISAWLASVTSIMTPPFNISASPVFKRSPVFPFDSDIENTPFHPWYVTIFYILLGCYYLVIACTTALFAAQGLQRIDSRSPAGGEVTGTQGNQDENSGDARQNPGIVRTHIVEQAGCQAHQKNRRY